LVKKTLKQAFLKTEKTRDSKYNFTFAFFGDCLFFITFEKKLKKRQIFLSFLVDNITRDNFPAICFKQSKISVNKKRIVSFPVARHLCRREPKPLGFGHSTRGAIEQRKNIPVERQF
jgi:hypothetical protein